MTLEGIYTLVDGREVDIGVDWDEPLDVRARAVRRALKRKLGSDHFERCDPHPSRLHTLGLGKDNWQAPGIPLGHDLAGRGVCMLVIGNIAPRQNAQEHVQETYAIMDHQPTTAKSVSEHAAEKDPHGKAEKAAVTIRGNLTSRLS